MPRFILLAASVLTMVVLQAPTCQDEGVTWNKTFGGTENDLGFYTQQTSDGGFVVVGRTYSYGAGDSDLWLIKTDSQGNEEWSKTFGGSEFDEGIYLTQTEDEGFILTGCTSSFGVGEEDLWLIKTDSKGNEEWSKTFGGSNRDVGAFVEQTTDRGFIITGGTLSFGARPGRSDVWLIKTDSEGNEQWSKTFGGSGWDGGISAHQTPDNGFTIIGYTYSFGAGDSDVWLIKTDSEGNEEWSKTFGGSELDWSDGRSTIDGGFIFAGMTASFGNGDMDLWLIKTDSEGNEEWSKTFGGKQWDQGSTVQQTTDAGFIITGWTETFDIGHSDVWLIKTDSRGNLRWATLFGNTDWDKGNSVQQTTDEGFILTGWTGGSEPSGDQAANILLIKTDSQGNAPDEKFGVFEKKTDF